MTAEEFRSRYQFLKQLTDGRVRSYHALGSTGGVVMVHCLHGDPSERRARLDLVHRLGPADRAMVVETVELDDTVAVVTRFIPDFDSFDQWLELRTGSGSSTASQEPLGPASAAVAEPPPRPSDEPGEFTRFFRAPAAEQGGAPAPERSGTAPAAGPPPGDAESGRSEETPATRAEDPGPAPSEFTRFFKAPEPSDPAPRRPGTDAVDGPGVGDARTNITRPFLSAPSRPGAAADSASAPHRPGGGGNDPRQPDRSAAPAASGSDDAAPEAGSGSEPGEFTRFFKAPSAGRDSEPPPGPPPGEGAAEQGPGEFTRMFGQVDPAPGGRTDPPEPARRDPSPEQGPGEFTRMFGQVDRAPSSQPDPPRPAGGKAPPDPGPGEFTRMFGQVDPPTSKPPDLAAPPLGSGSAGPPPVAPAPPPVARRPEPEIPGQGADYLDRLAASGSTGPSAVPPGASPPRMEPVAGPASFGPPQAPPPPPPAEAPRAGPSDFTRIIQASPAPGAQPATPLPPPPAPASAPVAPAAPPPKASVLPLVIGMGLIVLAAVGLILYLALAGD